MTKRAVVGLVATLIVALSLMYLYEEKIAMLKTGDRAPEFSGRAHNGTTVSLSEYRGKKNVILYFYPKDFTAGCTAQACSLRDNFDELSRLDAVIIGVSGDGGESHARFASSNRLPFLLVSDESRNIIRHYGATWLGGLLPITKRVTYVIDKEGIIRAVVHHELDIAKHVEDIAAALRTGLPPSTP